MLANDVVVPPRNTAFGLSLGDERSADLWSIHGDGDFTYAYDWYGLGGIVGYGSYGFVGAMIEQPNGDWLIEANEVLVY